MGHEIGFIFIGIEETDDATSGNKAKSKIPIIGIPAEQVETIAGKIKHLIHSGHLNIRVNANIYSNIYRKNKCLYDTSNINLHLFKTIASILAYHLGGYDLLLRTF